MFIVSCMLWFSFILLIGSCMTLWLPDKVLFFKYVILGHHNVQ